MLIFNWVFGLFKAELEEFWNNRLKLNKINTIFLEYIWYYDSNALELYLFLFLPLSRHCGRYYMQPTSNDQCRCIKFWSFPPTSGQLCRTTLTPALPRESAKSVTRLASKLNFSIFSVLLPSPLFYRCWFQEHFVPHLYWDRADK